MPSVKKIGKAFVNYFDSYETDKILNVRYGKNGRVITNNILRMDDILSKYVNDRTMGVLDNYAQHERVNIYIKPLEQDLFDNLQVSVVKKNLNRNFSIKLNEEKDVPTFLKELYKKVHKTIHPISEGEENKTLKSKFKTFIKTLEYNINNKRFEFMRNYVEKHKDNNGIKRIFSDILEEVNYNK